MIQELNPAKLALLFRRQLELCNVKKGETIKRGQVIGKAGQTGNVSSPQLHFEVRKGATPVDPTQYLTGG